LLHAGARISVCVYVTLGGRVYSVYTVVVGLHDQPDLKWEEQIRNFKVLLHVIFRFLRVPLRTNSDHKYFSLTDFQKELF
jgi:hypothetical protein